MSAWSRLQALSCGHAARIGKCGYRQHSPSDVIRENCEILGRGDDEEIKSRVHWYIVFQSAIFTACSNRRNSEVKSHG